MPDNVCLAGRGGVGSGNAAGRMVTTQSFAVSEQVRFANIQDQTRSRL